MNMMVSTLLIVLGGLIVGAIAIYAFFLPRRKRTPDTIPDTTLPLSIDPAVITGAVGTELVETEQADTVPVDSKPVNPAQVQPEEPAPPESPVENTDGMVRVSARELCLNVRTINPEIVETLSKTAASLPRLPTVALDLLPVLAKSGTGTKEVSEIVQRDQATAARLLRWVNSSLFGLESQIDSLHRAVTLLGLDIVRSAVLEDAFGRSGIPPQIDGFGPETIWRHAAAVSVVSKHLAVSARGISPDVAATAGLLHDIGLLLMLTFEFSGLERSLQSAREENIPLVCCEDNCIGFNHQVWGEIFIRSWKLPEGIAIAIGSHHSPLLEPVDHLAALLWLADYTASKLGFACPEDMVPEADENEVQEIMTMLGLRPSLGWYVTDGLLRELARSTKYWASNLSRRDSTPIAPAIT